MSGLREEVVDGVRIVHLEGCAADTALAESLESLSHHAGPTVLDLADLTLVGSDLPGLIDRLVETCDAVCVIARRHTARVILHRSSIEDRCTVFATLGDALQSLRHGDEGRRAGRRRLSGAGR